MNSWFQLHLPSVIEYSTRYCRKLFRSLDTLSMSKLPRKLFSLKFTAIEGLNA
jgi:hypothetical protein